MRIADRIEGKTVSDNRTTQRYSRGDLKSNSEVAVLRVISRTKKD